MNDNDRVLSILPVLPEKIGKAVRLSVSAGNRFEEIRLRRNMPVMITKQGNSLFLSSCGDLSPIPENSIYCDGDKIESTLLKLCENSVFAHTKEIEAGYIAMPGGIRAGVCGDISPGISGIDSVNIRIPRQVKGCADELFSAFSGGMLIAGPPGSGKTTLLRELIRKLSYKSYRIGVIDSRREISGGKGQYSFDLGPNTDVLFMADKSKGSEIMLRSMYPQIIAFDEIGNSLEAESVLQAFNSGVFILTSAHALNIEDLKRRPAIRHLLDSKVLKNVVLLPRNIGEKPEIFDVWEI